MVQSPHPLIMISSDCSRHKSLHQVGINHSVAFPQIRHHPDPSTNTDTCSLMTMMYLLLEAINGSFMLAFLFPTLVALSTYKYPVHLTLPHCSFRPHAISLISFSLESPRNPPSFQSMASRRSSFPIPWHGRDRINTRSDNPNK